MNPRKVIFRADGGSDIGMGHFVRTLALAEMLKDDFYCIYATQTPSAYQKNEIGKVCHERIDLPANETHFYAFLNKLNGNEIVVLDNYYFTTEYQRNVIAKGCKLVCIDDMHSQHFVAHVVINHAEGICKSQYSAEKYTQFCLGYKFALLRKEFLTDVRDQYKKKYACLLMMGGSDSLNLTSKILSIISPLQFSLPIAVVVGDNYNYIQDILQFENVELFKGIAPLEIFLLMRKSQFGLFPASTVAIEACAARLPFICGYYVENQKENYNGIETNHFALCVSNYLAIEQNDFSIAFEKLKNKNFNNELIAHQERILDKKSKSRYIDIFNSLWKV